MCIYAVLEEVFDDAKTINVYRDGTIKEYRFGEEGYLAILSGWKDMIKGAHDMPAFGVSINDYTVMEMKKGTWVEFDFGKTYESNGMPYERLLINVQTTFYGFNLIRYNSEHGYDGRCFYLDLVNRNMSKFYDVLLDN